MNIKQFSGGVFTLLCGLVSTLYSPVFHKWFSKMYGLGVTNNGTFYENDSSVPVSMALTFWCFLLFLGGIVLISKSLTSDDK